MVSWLPLYHDMGLIGLLTTPMSIGAEVVLGSPHEFISRPSNWPAWLSEFRGTVTGGPNFGFVLAARAMGRMDGLDLSSVRAEVNGAEPIDLDSMERYNRAGRPFGLSPGAMMPVFGLAEATLAVSFPAPGRGPVADVVDGGALEREGTAAPVAPDAPGARRLPLLGRPLPHVSVRVTDPGTGDQRPERMVGEIEIAGPSVTPGYYRQPEATAAAMHDGWLRTGDLGYLAGGELVVTGRLKDLIIVGGRNVYPQDVEWAVAQVDGVRAGNVVAFGITDGRGHERIVVMAEARATDRPALRRAVADRVQSAVGLPPADVVLLEPGELPKTSSGKLQRRLSRSRYLGIPANSH
jgi:fatty-acyl-CoA synthase